MILKEIFPETSAIIYGEGYGAGIQKGGGYSPTKEFVVFDVLVDGKWWLSWENTCDVANKLNLKPVPYLGEWSLDAGIDFVRNGFESILAKETTGETIQAEGIVGRTCDTMYDIGDYMGYKDRALSDEEALESFVAKYNIKKERKCISCGGTFMSPGAHIRKCQECKNKEQTRSQHNAEFEESFTCKSHHPGAIIPKDTDSELIRGLVTAWLPF